MASDAGVCSTSELRAVDGQVAPARGDVSLSVSDVSVIYPNGHVGLRDASFELDGGTICALVGVNGSGKSTLFKAIMGFVEPKEGARSTRRSCAGSGHEAQSGCLCSTERRSGLEFSGFS